MGQLIPAIRYAIRIHFTMQPKEKIIKCYAATAANYAAERIDEIYKKHLDSLLLKEFALTNKNKGLCADLGCGPGHTTKFLYDEGLVNIIGMDISTEMIKTARRLFPNIKFESGNLLDLSYKESSFESALAFYSIVHFDYDQVKIAFKEINRVLDKLGQFLFSFHVGNDVVHFDKAGNVNVNIDLYFFQTDKIIGLLNDAGFGIVDALERLPYENVEYNSKRGYIWAEKK